MKRANQLRTRFLTTTPLPCRIRDGAADLLERARKEHREGNLSPERMRSAQRAHAGFTDLAKAHVLNLYARLARAGPLFDDPWWVEVNARLCVLCRIGATEDRAADSCAQWRADTEGDSFATRPKLLSDLEDVSRKSADQARRNFIGTAQAYAMSFNARRWSRVVYLGMRMVRA